MLHHYRFVKTLAGETVHTGLKHTRAHKEKRRAGLAGQLRCFLREAMQTYTSLFIPLHREQAVAGERNILET